MQIINKKYIAAFILIASSSISSIGQRREFSLPNSSMEPTILVGEKFTANMNKETLTNIRRGDLVIISQGGTLVVKRIIAIAGDRIEGKNLKVFLNGKLLSEKYIQHVESPPLEPKTLETFGPIAVKSNQFFVMGDNRDVSFDSRDPAFGIVSFSQLRGRPATVISSPRSNRVGKTIR
jgi:signal peptidase I